MDKQGLKERGEDIITDDFNESEGNGVSDASGNYEYIEDRVVDEATTAILTLIEKEKVKARIDELKKCKDNEDAYIVSEASVIDTVINSYDVRIKELKAKLNRNK